MSFFFFPNYLFILFWASLVGLSGKESTCQCTRAGLFPQSGRLPGEGNGNPLQYSCLGNLADRGAWQATVQGVAKESDTT